LDFVRVTALLELVVAASDNDVIGRGNKLPWHLPADLRHFKALTVGKTVLMGRRTYESIGKALPNRTNIVMSRSSQFAPLDARVVGALQDACAIAGGEPLMVIGGGEIYRQCLPLASRIHLTQVHAWIEGGDTFFGEWRLAPWRESARERFDPDEKNAHAYSFVTLDNIARLSEPADITSLKPAGGAP
jgi:dihydrofolate reductase